MKKIIFNISIFLFTAAVCLMHQEFDLDLWSRLAVGKMFFENGHILKQDIFSYTKNNPVWYDHEWGSSVVFYFIVNHFGDAGIYALKIIIFFLTVYLVSKTISLKKDNTPYNILYYLMIIFGLFLGYASVVRCQIFTFFFFALFLYLLEKVRLGSNKLLFLFPFLMIIWTNLHGGFMVGLCTLGLYTLGEFLNKKPAKNYLTTFAASCLVTLINPYGIGFLKYMLKAATMPRPYIVEWGPTDLLGPWNELFYYKLLLVLTVLVLGYAFFNLVKTQEKSNIWPSIDKTKLLMILFTAYISLSHIKHQPFFMIAAGIFVYHDFYNFINTLSSRLFKFKIPQKVVWVKESLIYLIIIFIGSIITLGSHYEIAVLPTKYPVGSVQFIKDNNLKGNVLTLFNWGSYTTWNLYPDCKIAVDGRYEEVYPDDVVEETGAFIYVTKKNWYDFVNDYPTDIIILSKDFPSYGLLKQRKEWTEVYNDISSAVFLPTNKVKKNYVYPNFLDDSIIKNKYKTSI